MKNKIIDFLFAFFVPEINHGSESENKREWINMNLQYIQKKESNLEIHLRINISFIDDRILDIEFFDESDDIEIIIYNEFSNEIYRLSIYTMPTLHVIVEMKEWTSGFYQLVLQNKEFTFFVGVFTLNKIK